MRSAFPLLLALSVFFTLSQAHAQVDIQMPGIAVTTGEDGVQVKMPGIDVNTGSTPMNVQTEVTKVVSSTGSSFTNAELQNMDFSGKSLVNARFSNAQLTDVTFEGANLVDASFSNVECQSCNFRGADLSGADFSNAHLENSDFRGAIVIGTKFSNADFEGSKINGVDFSRADVSNASFNGADYSSSYTVTSKTIRRQLTETKVTDSKYHKTPSINLSIHFATDSDKLEGDAWEQLAELSKALNDPALKTANILIEGHTDSDASDEYNVDLSYRRAATVMQTLSQKLGVDASRLSIKGFGESHPVADNNTAFGKAQNRRVTIVNLSSK